MPSQGKEYLVWLTTNGLAGGTQVAVDYQGAVNLKTGKGLKTTMFKRNQAFTAVSTDGISFDLNILAAEPLGPAAALMMDASDNETDVYVYFQTVRTGGQRYQGLMKCVMTQQDTETSDASMLNFTFGQSGTNTRSTV